MTRIGRVTMKFDEAKHYAPTIVQHVIEDGECKLATFKYDRALYRGDFQIMPGRIIRLTHFRYQRVA